jgi:hypothetical protein
MNPRLWKSPWSFLSICHLFCIDNAILGQLYCALLAVQAKQTNIFSKRLWSFRCNLTKFLGYTRPDKSHEKTRDKLQESIIEE